MAMQIFGIMYYTFSYIQQIPQIIKLIRTKSSNDYSILQALLHVVATICWLVYIFTVNEALIVKVGSIIDLILVSMVAILVMIYYKWNKK